MVGTTPTSPLVVTQSIQVQARASVRNFPADSPPFLPVRSVQLYVVTSIGSGNWSSDANTNTQQYCDLASNCTVFQNAAIVVNNTVPPGYMIDEVAPTVGPITFSPASAGNVYTQNQTVSANFSSCSDVGSGLASCVGNGSIPSGGHIVTSTIGNNLPFTVVATDLAGNTTSSTVYYSVVAPPPSADVALFEQPGSATRGTTFNAVFWALDLSSNAASNVTINATLNLPPNVLGGNVSAVAGLVSCTLAGCNTLTTGTTCTVTSNTTVSCPIGNLAQRPEDHRRCGQDLHPDFVLQGD